MKALKGLAVFLAILLPVSAQAGQEVSLPASPPLFTFERSDPPVFAMASDLHKLGVTTLFTAREGHTAAVTSFGSLLVLQSESSKDGTLPDLRSLKGDVLTGVDVRLHPELSREMAPLLPFLTGQNPE